jgi:hypothetical protein
MDSDIEHYLVIKLSLQLYVVTGCSTIIGLVFGSAFKQSILLCRIMYSLFSGYFIIRSVCVQNRQSKSKVKSNAVPLTGRAGL